jgi:hypothetical protein
MPAGTYGSALSPISQYYLLRMYDLCRTHNVTLHVLPSPLSTREHFVDAQGIYAMPPMRVDPATLMDAVHFQRRYIAEMRARATAFYHLPLNATR